VRPTRRGNAPTLRSRTLGAAALLMAAGALLAFGPTFAVNAWDAYLARLQQADTTRWIASHLPSGTARRDRHADDGVMTPGRTGYLLEIPRIGVRIVVHLLEPGVFRGLNTPTLYRYGVGQVPFTTALGNVSPGAAGTAVITGHRTTSGAPFRHLDLLKPGDQVILRKDAAIQRWRVEGSATVAPADVDAIRSRPGVRRLVLLTCTPPFSARARLMVDARLAQMDAANSDTIGGISAYGSR
jgi:sortase A